MATPRKKPEDILPSGRPTLYKEEYNDDAFRLTLLGLNDKELAHFFEVDVSTLDIWKNRYPKFFESIKDGREKADGKVAVSLYKKALGYVKSDGTEIPPDTQAASLWLRNRQPKRWRDKQEVTHEGLAFNIVVNTEKE